MEQSLIDRYLAGDRTAFGQLLNLHKDAVMQTAYAVLGDVDEAQDACQETWVRVYRKLGTFRVGAEFRPWLLTIAANEAYTRRRVLWRAQRLLSRQSEQTALGAPRERDHDGRLDALMAIRRLPRLQATAIVLRYYHDLSVPQIAAAMERPEGTVKYWLSRAVQQLRTELGERDDTIENVQERFSDVRPQ